MNLDRIQEALTILEEEGRKGYKSEYQDKIPKYQAIGHAIAHVNDSGLNCIELAYSWLEDWNRHDLCAVLEWVYPIYRQVFHTSDLQRLERMINKRDVTVLAEDYDKKVINVRLVFEDVTEGSAPT